MGSDPLNSDLDGTAIAHCGSASNGPLWAMVIEGHASGARDLQIVDWNYHGCANNAAGGILLNGTSRGIESAKFTDIFLYRFLSGTALKLLASNGGAIAYAEFYSVRVRYCKVAIHLHAADDIGSSFVNSNRFFGGVISGTTHDAAILIEGPGANNLNIFFGITVE